MGSFCEQYEAIPLRPQSKPKNKKTTSKERKNSHYHKKINLTKTIQNFIKNLTRNIIVWNLTKNIIINLNLMTKMLNAISVVVLAIILINERFKKKLIN